MKDMDLLKAVGQIDDKFIEEADSVSISRTARRRRWVSVAASVAVVVGIGALIATGSLGGFGGAASKNDRMYSRNTAPANNSMPMPEANTAAEDGDRRDITGLLPNGQSEANAVDNKGIGSQNMLVLKIDMIDVSACDAEISVVNNSDKEVVFGEEFHIFRNENGVWQEVPYKNDNIGWHAVGYTVGAGETWTKTINWEHVYGSLGSGRYQLQEPYSIKGAGIEYICTCEFTIE